MGKGLHGVHVVKTELECGSVSSGSRTCVRIFRIGPGSVMKAIRRMSPPQVLKTLKIAGHIAVY